MLATQLAVARVIGLWLEVAGGVEELFFGQRLANSSEEIDEAVDTKPPQKEAGILHALETLLTRFSSMSVLGTHLFKRLDLISTIESFRSVHIFRSNAIYIFYLSVSLGR